jgi:signal transduction histidine kinase/CheY-like chemotaxis protein
LGSAAPSHIVVLPVLFEDRVLAVVELASFRPFSEVHQAFLAQIVETVGVVLNTIIATTQTEVLLEQSQSLAQELQSRSAELQNQQEELQKTNAEIEEKALQLARQNRAIEVKNAEIELARRELEDRAEQLALSSKYKSEFLANMSHELRTPLNSLLILAKLLAENPEGNLTPRQVEYSDSIRDAGYDLLALISDILDLSKVEAGKMDIAIRPVRLAALCRDLEQTFRPIAEQQQLGFSVEMADDLPDTIPTDEHRVQQILKNLLSNAFKFTESGSVAMRVSCERDGSVCAFSVSDSGIGIESDKLAMIFEAFQQAEGTTNRRFGGTGLGLSISREIAGLLGGHITVESRPGKGSTFTLLLPIGPLGSKVQMSAEQPVYEPLMPVDDTGETAPSQESDAAAVSGRRVLIVDDDVRNVYALTSALEDRGIEVLCATSGKQGIEALQENPETDLVLMDIMMPEMDGHATTRAIREMDQFKNLPIIALTAKAMPGDRENTLAAGASDYITKPVDFDQLLNLMRVWLYQ